MKKLLYWAMAALLVTGFTACNNEEPAPEPDPTPVTPDPEPEPEPEPFTPDATFVPNQYAIWLGDGGWGDVTNGNYTISFEGQGFVFTDNHAGDGNCWKTQVKINSKPNGFDASNGQTLKVSYKIKASNDVSVACLKVAQFAREGGAETEICAPFQFADAGKNSSNADGAAAVKLTANQVETISFEKVLAADYENISLVMGLNGAQGTVYTVTEISVTVE